MVGPVRVTGLVAAVPPSAAVLSSGVAVNPLYCIITIELAFPPLGVMVIVFALAPETFFAYWISVCMWVPESLCPLATCAQLLPRESVIVAYLVALPTLEIAAIYA
jgi:hypothetical protein